MDEKRASSFGVMNIDKTGRIVAFGEKPKARSHSRSRRPERHMCARV
jgi:ADP-glucose pyrophosphorylase